MSQLELLLSSCPALSSWPIDARHAALNARAVFEQLAAKSEMRSELAISLRELLAPQRIHVELVRDLHQPAEWFEQVEANVAEPTIERIGLALRRPPEPWILFPKARLLVPFPEVISVAEEIHAAMLQSGYGELLEAADGEVRRRIASWKDAAARGTLELAATQFYVDFYGELGERLRQRDSESAGALRRRLLHFLQFQLRLFPFSPATYLEYPDGWVSRASGKPMVSGRVTKVIRPGLQDDQNQLRVPALVDVE